jgi:hypothetical protein
MTKIDSKNSLYPHRHFIEQLAGVFRKSRRKNNFNHESSSLLIRRLKSKTRFDPATMTSNRKIKIVERQRRKQIA